MSSRPSGSLKTYLLIKFIFMVISVTAAIFVYYYVVDLYFTNRMYDEYLDYEHVDLMSYKTLSDDLIDEYGLTVHVIDSSLNVIDSVGIHAGEKQRYTLEELIDTCNTDNWKRYVMHKSFTDSSSGNENIVIWIQDVSPLKFSVLQNKLNLMIALVIIGIIGIIVVFVNVYYRDIYSALADEFLYIQEKITRLPHHHAKIETSRFRFNEARELAGSYNDTIQEMTDIKAENAEILRNSNQLITDLSHDIKSPLTSLSGYTRLLREDGTESTDMDTYIRYIENSIDDLNSIVTMLFEQVELRRTQITLNRTPNNINDILRDVCANYYSAFSSRGFSVEVDIEEEPRILVVDRINIKRVFNNILDNFLRHNHAPTDIRVTSETRDNCVIIEFMNNGDEIPDEIKPKIFNPYYHRNKKNPEQGSGLGLHIAKSIVEKHGGSIILTSADGYRTVFRLSLIYS